ncbi:MAG: nickel-responsive transcriptional regulator NikR [Phycisphaerales bacterium]|nr:MAG: nickel-responsive transcriptional regulator NikR [Phycisphaerales bacterium]
MAQVDRFSVSLDTELLAAFDRHIADRGYQNRSEAIRDLIRDLLVASRVEHSDEPAAAVLTVVCDHRQGEAPKRLRACLTANSDLVTGSLSIPIDQHRDSLAIGLKGPADRVQALANQIQAMRGVAHGHLSAVPVSE